MRVNSSLINPMSKISTIIIWHGYGMEWNEIEWNGIEWNGIDVECQDLLIPHRSMHGGDLRFQSQNYEISRTNFFFFFFFFFCD